MAQSKQCPKCSSTMVEGFNLDRTHGSVGVTTWVEGTPDKSVWTGLRLTGREQRKVSVWRCGRCGFLEQYALEDVSAARTGAKQQHTLLAIIVLVATMILALVVGFTLA